MIQEVCCLCLPGTSDQSKLEDFPHKYQPSKTIVKIRVLQYHHQADNHMLLSLTRF